MPPLPSTTMEAESIKLQSTSGPTQPELSVLEQVEVKVHVKHDSSPRLKRCSSLPPFVDSLSPFIDSPSPFIDSPLPLTEHSSGVLGGNSNTELLAEVTSLCHDLQLSTYEYATLEDRYGKLWSRHLELRKTASAYDDIIRGFPSHEGQTVSIDQLQSEAGREGLRAKALEADILRPTIREAGGLQALVSQANLVNSLIEQAGGLQKLVESLSETHTLRKKVEDMAETSRHESQQHTSLMCELAEVRTKAQKYEKLQQAFATIQKEPADSHSKQQGLAYPSLTVGRDMNQSRKASMLASSQSTRSNASSVSITMNPERARLLSGASFDSGFGRDLHNTSPPPVFQPERKTGANSVPLRAPLGLPWRADLNYGRLNAKRKEPGEASGNVAKRPRLNVERASAMVHGSLAGQAQPNTNNFDSLLKQHSRIPGNTPETHARVDKLAFQLLPMAWPISMSLPVLMSQKVGVASDIKPGGWIVEHVPRVHTITTEPIQTTSTEETNVKLEEGELEDDDQKPQIMALSKCQLSVQAAMGLKRYPIAFFHGAPDPKQGICKGLKAGNIPSHVADFLANELSKFISNSNVHLWNSMPPNKNICILSYLIDGHRPSDQPQPRRACSVCSSEDQQPRPCAMLQDFFGARIVIFLPLHEKQRNKIGCKDRGFWVLGAQ
ncbi:hypothetical protein P153DRAFT_391726 [Dothidotthia symphoricarpi CBS 119687]|uniref:Uncharacterized protein n=1 Tax=Dothidotthia symphoricarpi CBS 119687 TaxID=1392245 RepID=A0A6A6AT41_9PLEO|nr:uncharacterized protein P153DRAFT_391726 [Dothidotthia symphoricarpi CBS 119687]KAF2134383.1 hypothetical protein P153DRAFT_391726 [Dothidotthia symphoricarpi CBS 119687]